MIPRKWWQASRAYREGGDGDSGSNYSNEGRNYSTPVTSSPSPDSGGFSSGWTYTGNPDNDLAGMQYYDPTTGKMETFNPGGSADSSSGGPLSGRAWSNSSEPDSWGGENRLAEQRKSEEAEGGVKSININNTGKVLGRNNLLGVALAQQHEDFVNGKSGEIGPDLKAAYESLSDADKKAYLLETHKPVGENYTYNPLDKGWREKLSDLTTGKQGTVWRTLGGTGAGVSGNQYFDNETPEEKTARMQLVNGIIGKAIDVVSPWQFTLLKNGAQAISDVSNGASWSDALGRVGPGLINRVAMPAVDRVTGGLATKLSALNSLSSLAGGPSVKSIGDAAWTAMGGGQPPGQQTVNNPDTGRPYLYPDSTPITIEPATRSSSSSSSGAAAPQETAAPVATASPDINANLFGNLSQSGWRSASAKYAQSRKKGMA